MDLAGVLAPIPTPFDQSGRIDETRLRKALRRWLRTSLAGVVVLGSTGEAPLLDDDEADRVIGAARDVVPRKRTFVVGAGRESTRSAIRAAKRAARHGADAVLVRTPGFYKSAMTSGAFVAHYSAVADASPIPVLLYNFTALTGVELPVEAVGVLARHPNIVGMKESGSDVPRITDLAACASSAFSVLAGSATTFHQALAVGAVGGILAAACVLPEVCVRLYRLTISGRQEEARALQQRLLPIVKLLGSGGVPGLKAAATLAGYDAGFPRSPLLPAPPAAVAALQVALAGFNA